ncbi:ABC transporter substrate-binding protein [Streptomyces sp. NPDC050546]|uniref:ABC transporter substrate-binding protein n=1 Tax=Streptomyces sp. NPDC050546 TaxID=3365628 RepID=UPI0037947D36
MTGVTVRRLAAVLVTAGVLAACGAESGTSESGKQAEASGSDVRIERCGENIRLERPASRAVTLNQHATELVLAMGLGDRLIGSSLLDNPVRADLKSAYGKVPVLSQKAYPSKETLIGLGPDVLIGGFGPTFSEANGLPPDQFRSAGIGLFTIQCKGQKLTFTSLIETVTALGTLFGEPDAARKLNARLTEQWEEVKAQVKGADPVDVLVFDSGQTAPTVAGGQGLANTLVTTAGGRNVFSDLKSDWGEGSWDEVVRRDPDVILVVDYFTAGNTARDKIKQLRSDPVLRDVTAVKENRFLVVGLTGLGALSPRNPEVAADIADELHPQG